MCYSNICIYEKLDGECRGEASRQKPDALCQLEMEEQKQEEVGGERIEADLYI
jgi:hypothetical protein